MKSFNETKLMKKIIDTNKKFKVKGFKMIEIQNSTETKIQTC